MSKHGIESDIPFPDKLGKYPWPEMGHGDSRLFDLQPELRDQGSHRLRNAAYQYLKHHRPEWKAVCRVQSDGIRIWFKDPDHAE